MYRSTKEYEESDEVREVAEEVISDKGIDVSMCNIRYLKVYPNISKTKVANCRVTNNREYYFSDADYLITVSGDIWDELDEERKYILVWHELLHIHPEYSESRGEYNFKVRKHDVEDFAEIIEEEGTDWFMNMKEIVASFHDMDPSKKKNIRA